MAAAALAVTDELVLPLRAVGDLAAAAGVSREEVVVITQCASLGGKLPFDDASVGAVLSFIKKVESFGDQLVAEINRVLKAGGIVLVQSLTPSSDQKVEQCVTSIPEDHEATCWGCGLRLVFTSYAPVYKCGWCGAVTQSNQTSRKPDSVCFSRWRRFRDGFFVTVLILFMLFVICGGVWAVYPVVFSISVFCGIFHCTVAALLAVFTIASYCLASLKSAGAPASIRWGSYPTVGKNDLENYTFCTYCSKPKPPRAHHCRSCKMCVVDMDHHCPFIGNCVGASNHRAFVIFLISVVTSCSYAAIMTIFASYHIWPPIDFPNLSTRHSMGSMKVLMDIITSLASSAFFLSARGLILLYLAFASLSVNAGIAVLLCQQLSYIYEGNTYLSRLSSPNAMQGERGLQNIVRFFECPYPFSRVLLGYSSKSQDNSGSKLL